MTEEMGESIETKWREKVVREIRETSKERKYHKKVERKVTESGETKERESNGRKQREKVVRVINKRK